MLFNRKLGTQPQLKQNFGGGFRVQKRSFNLINQFKTEKLAQSSRRPMTGKRLTAPSVINNGIYFGLINQDLTPDLDLFREAQTSKNSRPQSSAINSTNRFSIQQQQSIIRYKELKSYNTVSHILNPFKQRQTKNSQPTTLMTSDQQFLRDSPPPTPKQVSEQIKTALASSDRLITQFFMRKMDSSKTKLIRPYSTLQVKDLNRQVLIDQYQAKVEVASKFMQQMPAIATTSTMKRKKKMKTSNQLILTDDEKSVDELQGVASDLLTKALNESRGITYKK